MNKKLQRIIMLIYVIVLLVMISGATFAFFTFVRVGSISPQVEVSSATTEFIVFDAGKAINITPNRDNFGSGMGNLYDETFASAYVRVAQGVMQSSYKYNLFLEIEKNNLEYSTESKLPELVLTIIDYEGNEVKEIDGLEYVNVNGVSGFDITTAVGRYYIKQNQEITTSTEVSHKWIAKVTFVNLEEPQDGNFQKELKGYIQIEKAFEDEK